MRTRVAHVALAVAAATALSAFTSAGADVPGVAHARGHGRPVLVAAPQQQAASGAELWVKRYNGPGNSDDKASAVAVSPSADTIFVTGYSTGAGSGLDYATIAYDAATGAPSWVRRYAGGSAAAMAVSPDGKTVFVTGQFHGQTNESYDYGTVAYDAATGAQLWAQGYNGPGNWFDAAASGRHGVRLRHGRVQHRHRSHPVGQAVQRHRQHQRLRRVGGRRPGRGQSAGDRDQSATGQPLSR